MDSCGCCGCSVLFVGSVWSESHCRCAGVELSRVRLRIGGSHAAKVAMSRACQTRVWLAPIVSSFMESGSEWQHAGIYIYHLYILCHACPVLSCPASSVLCPVCASCVLRPVQGTVQSAEQCLGHIYIHRVCTYNMECRL